MSEKIIFMFSGQGSQYYQMGRELYENHKQFKYWMEHCDKIVSPLIQKSLIDILYKSKGKSEQFDRLLYSNPALLCIEYSLVNVLKEMGINPDFLMGYSLGEITASVVSGVISLEDGIKLVVDVAKHTEEKTPQARMLAVMSSKMIITEFPDLFANCQITGTNFQDNFVVSGLPDTIKHIKQGLDNDGITSQILPVNYGFHTELIEPIKEEFKNLVRGINQNPMGIPIISTYKTEIIEEWNEDFLWEVIRYPINFERTVERIQKSGDYHFIDVGPSGTLATFVKYILSPDSGSITSPMINQFGSDLKQIEKLKLSLYGNLI